MTERQEILQKIFEDVGLDTDADIWEIENFIDDLYLQLNSDQFTMLWSKIFDKKLNGEL